MHMHICVSYVSVYTCINVFEYVYVYKHTHLYLETYMHTHEFLLHVDKAQIVLN